MFSLDAVKKGELVAGRVMRVDGTIRQIIVQDKDKRVYARGYFEPGTEVDQNWLFLEKVKYHWSDAFTDKELKELEVQDISEIRLEANKANIEKVFVHKK